MAPNTGASKALGAILMLSANNSLNTGAGERHHQANSDSALRLPLDSPQTKKACIAASLDITGAGDRNRTYDLRVTSALLYRLSYTG